MTRSTNHLAVIDTSVADYQTLVVAAQAQGMDVILISGEGDGADELAAALEGRENIDQLHLFSHGSVGEIHLGSAVLSTETLAENGAAISAIRESLSDRGDLLVYGCDVGAGAVGAEFVERLAQLTGADTAASDDATGHAALGGDWQLELERGTIENAPLAAFSFAGLLATPTSENFDDVVLPDGTHSLGTNGQSRDIDGWSFSLLTGSGLVDSDSHVDVTNSSIDTSLANDGSDKAARLEGGPDGAVEAVIKWQDGSEFDFDSITVEQGGGFDDNFRLVGYRDGLAVSGASQDFVAGAYGSGGTTVNVSGSAWEYLDEVRIRLQSGVDDISLYIDDIVVGAAVAPNSSPTLGGSATLTGTDEDTTSTETAVSALLGSLTTSDADGDTLGVAIVGALGNGTWQYSTNDGTSWSDLGAVSSSSSLLLSPDAQVRYDPDGVSGETATLDIRAWDQSTGTPGSLGDTTSNGGTTAYSSGTATAEISVTEINDDPSASNVPTDVTVTEDTESNLDLSALSLSDPDSASMTLTLTVGVGTFSTPVDGSGVGGGVTETLVSGTQVTLVGSPGDISTYLGTASNLRYTPASEVSGEDQASLTIVANDGDGSGDVTLGTANIDITAVNDAPVVSGSATLTGTDEDTPSAGTAVSTLIGSLTTSDADGDTLGVAIVGASGNGTWQYSTDSGSSWSDLGAVADNSATLLRGTDQVRYDPDGANGETAALTLRGWDQAAGASGDTGVDTTTNGGTTAYSSGTTTAGITVSEIDDAPTLSASRQDPTYVEGAAASDLFSGISATTVDIGESFTGLSLTVTNISDGASEVLSFDGSDIALTNGNSVTTSTNGLSVNVSVSGSTATVSFAGAALTDGEMQTLVDGLGYLNTSDDPTTGSNRVVTITSVTDSGSTSNTTALSVASTVSLTAVNDAPVIGNVNGDTDSVTAGAGAQNLTELDDATVSNPDSQYFNGGFLTLTQGSGASNGNWGLDGTNATAGGDGTIAAGETISIGGLALGTVDTTDDGQGGRALTIAFDTANATSAQIQAFIQNLTFSAPSGLGNRAFALTLDDGDGTANGGDSDATASFTASVRPNPPVIDNLDGDAVSARIGTAASFDAGGDVSVSDADSSTLDGGTLTISRTAALTGDFSLSTGATADGDAIIAAGETVQVGGTTMGVIKATADGQGSNDLVIDLTGAGATPANLETLLAALQFNPTDVGAHTFDVTLSDAAAGNQPATSLPSSVTLNASNPPSGGSNDPEPVPGTDEDDTFVAGDKPQNFEGGGGNDTVSYSQPMGGSKLLPQPDGTIVVERADGTRDTLSEIEHVQFGDKSFDFTVADQIENPELADQVIELYVAYFNRVPEASGLLYWLDQIKNGLSLDQTANAFFDAALQYGDQTGYVPNTSSEDLISTIYANVLGRTGDTAPNADEIEYWRDQMESGEVTRFGLIARMLGDARDFSEDVDWGWVSELLDNKLDLGHTHAITFGVNYTSPEDAITTTHDYMGGVSPEGNQQALDLVGVSFGELDG